MLRKLSISQQGLFAICLLLGIELLFVGTLATFLSDARASLEREKHTRTVTSGLHRVANITQKIGIRMIRSASPTELQQFADSVEDYHPLLAELNSDMDNLRKLLADNPKVLAKLRLLEQACSDTCNYYDASKMKIRNDGEFFQIFCTHIFELSERVKTRSQELIKFYRTTEADAPAKTSESLAKVKLLAVLGLIVNIVGAVVLAFLLQKRVAGRILVLTDNVRRFTHREPLNPRFNESDEIGRIDQLFHEMSSAITQATKNEKTLVENAAEVICQIDEDGRFTILSPSVINQWGFEPEQLLGTHYTNVIREDLRALAEEQIAEFKTSASGNRGSFETTVITNRGQAISTQWSSYWSTAEKSLFCFVHNISQQKNLESLLRAQEEQVRTAIENVPVGLLMIDMQGFVRSVNGTFERMSGRRRSDLLGRSVLSLFEKPGDANFDLLSIFKKLQPAQNFQLLLRNAGGIRVQIDLNVTPLTVEGREHKLLVCADATERIKLEKMKHEFVTLLGRNLRAPLQNTRARIAALLDRRQASKWEAVSGREDPNRKQTAEDKKHERLTRACSNIDRLLRLIDELLNIEMMAPGKLVGELEPTEIADVAQRAIDSVKDFAEQQGVLLESGKAVKGKILADSERLVQVAVNLLVNAVKFSPRGATVSLAVQDRGDNIEFSIIDQGRGVPEHMREEIFKPYSQTSTADGKRGQGTGLGLSICKTIVEAHRGSIGVESEEGKGSRFWFLIPPLASAAGSPVDGGGQ